MLRTGVAIDVMGERRHPALVGQSTVLEGELTVKRNERSSILRQGEAAVIKPGIRHDWWNASIPGGGYTCDISGFLADVP